MFRFIDLFAGAGGLSEGFIRSGFKPVCHVEMDNNACDTLKTRTVYHWLKEEYRLNDYNSYLRGDITKEEFYNLAPKQLLDRVINREMSKDSLPFIFDKVDKLLGKDNIDIIIGGPPCQAYSVAGRSRKNMSDDPRNHLYKYYIEFLTRYKPKMFVFENVPGILSAGNGEFLDKILTEIKDCGYDLDYKILDSNDFGVLQQRKRVILIGWLKGSELKYPELSKIKHEYTLSKDLFIDLPHIKITEGTMGVSEYASKPTEYISNYGYRNYHTLLTQHFARFNNENDLEIFRIAVDKWNNGERLKYTDLPSRLIKHKGIKGFSDKFKVVNGFAFSHTIIAHIGIDGAHYIHPDIKQNRSITVREAARIQSFPDDFFFEGSRGSAYKQIGNAVPVIMAQHIGRHIHEILSLKQI